MLGASELLHTVATNFVATLGCLLRYRTQRSRSVIFSRECSPMAYPSGLPFPNCMWFIRESHKMLLDRWGQSLPYRGMPL